MPNILNSDSLTGQLIPSWKSLIWRLKGILPTESTSILSSNTVTIGDAPVLQESWTQAFTNASLKHSKSNRSRA